MQSSLIKILNEKFKRSAVEFDKNFIELFIARFKDSGIKSDETTTKKFHKSAVESAQKLIEIFKDFEV